MIKFRTEVEIPQFTTKIGYRNQSLLIGSCFAENMGIYLEQRCFPVMVNPFGILYNPLSIANSLDLLMVRKSFTKQELFFSNGRYHSFYHHSRFSSSDPETILDQINRQAADASDRLKNGSHLFITFGTSWVFEHKLSGKVVSNCHKLPSETFIHKRLTINQITAIWIPLIKQLKEFNPELHIVFTVSPIRHLKDGAHENQLSKSILLLAIEEMVSHFNTNSVCYFPSYEIMMDELRDYRFYGTDMTHPSDLASDFIREKFIATFLDGESQQIISEVDKLLPAIHHKPFNPLEEGYISFVEKQISKLELLQNKYPFVNFTYLRRQFSEKTTN
jgi:GSCFA family